MARRHLLDPQLLELLELIAELLFVFDLTFNRSEDYVKSTLLQDRAREHLDLPGMMLAQNQMYLDLDRMWHQVRLLRLLRN